VSYMSHFCIPSLLINSGLVLNYQALLGAAQEDSMRLFLEDHPSLAQNSFQRYSPPAARRQHPYYSDTSCLLDGWSSARLTGMSGEDSVAGDDVIASVNCPLD